MSRNIETIDLQLLYVLTYIVGGIVSAVDDNFADSPRHLDISKVNFMHPNQNGHTRNLVHGQPFHKRKRKNSSLINS
jgi:hypothetical protein